MLIPEPGAFYVMDRGYLDFERSTASTMPPASSSSAPNPISNSSACTPSPSIAAPVCSAIKKCLVVFYSQQGYPERLRRIRYRDAEGRRLVFLTNNMTLATLTISHLYRSRWKVELFFKWIKQHLRIKRFFGTNENAVKTQVWIAVAVYVLVAIVRKRLNLELSLHEMLQILSITPFEKTSLFQLLTYSATNEDLYDDPNQLIKSYIDLVVSASTFEARTVLASLKPVSPAQFCDRSSVANTCAAPRLSA